MSRLIEYFLVVGYGQSLVPVDPPPQDPFFDTEPVVVEEPNMIDLVYKAKVIDRFPLIDYKETSFPGGLEMFALPFGLTLTTNPHLPELHYFAATIENGTRLYGCCLKFMDQVPEKVLRELAIKLHREYLIKKKQEKIKMASSSNKSVDLTDINLQTDTTAEPKNNIIVEKSTESESSTPISSQENQDTAEMREIEIEETETKETETPSEELVEEAKDEEKQQEEGVEKNIETETTETVVVDEEEKEKETEKSETQKKTEEKDIDNNSNTNSTNEDNASVSSNKDDEPKKDSSSSEINTTNTTIINNQQTENENNHDNKNNNNNNNEIDENSPEFLAAVEKMIPKCTVYSTNSLCILSQYPFLQQYRTFVTEMYRISLTPETCPIERTISNFIFEVPLPPQGRIAVKYRISDKVMILKRPPPNNPLAFSTFRLRLLFECLDLKNVEFVINALLTEQRILLLSSQLSALTVVTESLTSLLYPFLWRHVYIPLLPKALIDFINAPYPYLIGTHTSFLNEADFPEDVLCDITIVNLDTNNIKAPPLPAVLPSKEGKKLSKALQPMELIYRSKKSPYERKMLDNLDLAFYNAPMPDEVESSQTVMSEDDILEQETIVREAFFRVFVALFKDYREYMKPINRDEIDDGHFDFFETDAFLKSCPSSSQEFLKVFINTQAFQHFIQDRIFSASDDPNVVFFDESIIKKKNRSAFTRSKPTPFVDRKDFEIISTYEAPERDMTGVPPNTIFNYDVFPRLNPAYLMSGPRNADPLSLILTPKLKNNTTLPDKVFQRRTSIMLSDVGPEQVLFTVWFHVFTKLVIEEGCQDDIAKGFDILYLMEARNIIPEEEVFPTMMKLIDKKGTPQGALMLVTLAKKYGYQPNADMSSTLLRVFARAGQTNAMQELDKLAAEPDQVFPNSHLPNMDELKMDTMTRLTKRMALFEFNFPGLKFDLNETCPACGHEMTDEEIRQGWSVNENDYTTQCPIPTCNEFFVARFAIKPSDDQSLISHNSNNRHAKITSPVYCEYLSPWVLKKEIFNMLHQNCKKASSLLEKDFSTKSSALYWNLAWYLSVFQLPLDFCRSLLKKPTEQTSLVF